MFFEKDNKFLKLAEEGKNNKFYHYVFSWLFLVFFFLVVAQIPSSIWQWQKGFDGDYESLKLIIKDDVFSFLSIVGLNFLLFCFGLALSMRFIHKRSFKSLLTSRPSINLKALFESFLVWFVLLCIGTFVQYIFRPTHFLVTFNSSNFLILCAISLPSLFVQTATEEITFRGYLSQGLFRICNINIFPMLISSVLFAFIHFANPEILSANGLMQKFLMFFIYSSIGFFLSYLSVKSKSLELSIGVHWANNFFSCAICNYANSALPTPSLFSINKTDQIFELLSFFVMAAGFLAYYKYLKPLLFRLPPEKVLGDALSSL